MPADIGNLSGNHQYVTGRMAHIAASYVVDRLRSGADADLCSQSFESLVSRINGPAIRGEAPDRRAYLGARCSGSRDDMLQSRSPPPDGRQGGSAGSSSARRDTTRL